MEKVSLVKLNEIVKGTEKYYAHTRGEEKETLQEHTDTCNFYFKRIWDEKNLGPVFERIYNELFPNEAFKEIFFRMVMNVPNFHDFGKINPKFQKEKMDNHIADKLPQDSHHSKGGGVLFLLYFLEEIMDMLCDLDLGKEEEKIINRISRILLINVGIIKGHHGSLKDVSSLKHEIVNEYRTFSANEFYMKRIPLLQKYTIDDLEEDYLDCFYDFSENDTSKETLYIYQNLLFGLLVQADILATVDYTHQRRTEDFGLLKNAEPWREAFEEYRVTESIRKRQNQWEKKGFLDDLNDINILRSKMFLEAEENLDKESNIFQLEAPTGSGKTIASINLVLKLLEENKDLNKIFYAFPFNTLVDQTYNTLKDIFASKGEIMHQIGVFNSERAFEKIEDRDELSEEENYDQLYMDYQFLYSPFVVSTNVKLFDILFGFKKTSYYPLPLLANSVIVLDEIQSYKNTIWEEMVILLEHYAHLLNMKVIIMSATLPDFSYFLKNEMGREIKELLPNSLEYYEDPRFKNRVTLDFSMLEKVFETKESLFQGIAEKINQHCKHGITGEGTGKEPKKILIEFINKKTARDFYYHLTSLNDPEEVESVEVFLITGDTSILDRQVIIKKIQKWSKALNKDYILIGTQAIEAGVNISMDIGLKDISLLDSEEQFLGRINRNFKTKNSKAYFFQYDKTEGIYRSDIRAEGNFTLKEPNIQEILLNKDFRHYYGGLILKGIKNKNERSSLSEGIKRLGNHLGNLKNKEISEHFRLIEELERQTLFIGRTDQDFDFKEIWKEYVDILSNKEISFSERKVSLMRIRSKMSPYTYEVSKYVKIDQHNGYACGIYFIEDGDKAFEKGVFFPERIFGSIIDFM